MSVYFGTPRAAPAALPTNFSHNFKSLLYKFTSCIIYLLYYFSICPPVVFYFCTDRSRAAAAFFLFANGTWRFYYGRIFNKTVYLRGKLKEIPLFVNSLIYKVFCAVSSYLDKNPTDSWWIVFEVLPLYYPPIQLFIHQFNSPRGIVYWILHEFLSLNLCHLIANFSFCWIRRKFCFLLLLFKGHWFKMVSN